MRTAILTTALLCVSSTPSLAHPQRITDIQLISREDAVALDARSLFSNFADVSDLWKRKGGGGGGGKGGSGSSSSGSSSSGSSSSGSGSSSSGSGSSSSGSSSSGSSSSSSSGGKGSTSSSSSAGGATKAGSGVQPSYGGGRYYGGGSTSPYSAGRASPLGIAPVFLGVGALAVFPGLWLYGAYAYPYHNPYTFYNRSGRRNTTSTRRDLDVDLSLFMRQDTTTGVNETKPVNCLCAAYSVCGCDDNGNTTFLDSLVGDGSYSSLNQSVITVVDVNGTSTIVLNGTLPNGTTVEDASVSGAGKRFLVESMGYWAMIALVGGTVYLI